MADGRIIYEIRGDDSGLQGDIDRANQTAERGTSKLASIAKSAGVAIGAAFVAVGAAAVKFGSDFETSIAMASTLFGDVDVDVDNLQSKLLELSDSTGLAASELGTTLYNALSAGIPATEDMGEALAFLEANTKLAKAGFTDIDTAVTTTAKVLNAYKMDVSQTDRIHQILMQTQNKGIVTVGELGSVLAQVTPTASAFGVSFEQVGAAIANMTAQGTPAAQATTQLNQLIAELGKSGTTAAENLLKATEGTDLAGKSFTELMAEGVTLNEILDLMNGYANENGVSLLDMFSSIEAGRAALANGGQNSQAFADALAAMSSETDVVGEAFDKVSGTSAEQFKRILNELKNMAIELFNSLQPAIDQILPALSSMLAVIGPLMSDLVVQLMPSLVSLVEKILPPVTAVVEKLLPVIVRLLSILLPSLIQITEAVLPVVLSILDAIIPVLETALTVLEPILEIIIELLEPILELINLGLQPLLEAFQWVMRAIFETVSTNLGYVQEILSGLLDFVKAVFTGDWESAWDAVKNIFVNIWEGIKNAFKAPFNFIIDGINKLLEGLNTIRIPDWVPGIGGLGFDIPLIPRLKKGTPFVPEDFYPAYLDYGERVLTAEQNIKFNTLGGLEGMERALSTSVSNPRSEIQLSVKLSGDVSMDGFKVGEIVMKNIDDVRSFL